MCPFALYADDKQDFESECNEYKELSYLRLDDIWQKFSYDKLRILLEKKLSEKGISCKPYHRDKKSTLTPGFYLASGFSSRGHKGLVELRFVLRDNPRDEEPVSVMIQIEGNQYRYAVTADNIVPDNKKKEVTPVWNKLNDIDRQNVEEWIPDNNSGRNDWCHFGNSFIYRYNNIEPKKTSKSLIDCIVNDAQKILNCFGRNTQ